MLQLLVSVFLEVIFLLHFLSLVTSWTAVAFMIMKQNVLMATKEY